MAGVEALAVEVNRILSCPYPTSLAKLADLLAVADDRAVQQCIVEHPPCAIKKLASIVAEALPLWAFTVPLLRHLCRSREFRETFLLQDSARLDALLSKAVSSPSNFDHYWELCAVLLAGQLPSAIQLPASTQTFFLRVFEKAIENPDAHWMRTAYYLLNAACSHLFGILPIDVTERFDQELRQVLGSKVIDQEPMLRLWCCGIVVLIENAHGHAMSSCDPLARTTSGPSWRTSSGRKLFTTPADVQKTIDMAYVQVISIVKGQPQISCGDAIEGIRIACAILKNINVDVRRAWPKTTTFARGIFHKLLEKIRLQGVHHSIQLQALSFFTLIVDGPDLPEDFVTQYVTSMLRACESHPRPEVFGETLSLSLPKFAPRISQSDIRTIVVDVLRANKTWNAPCKLAGFEALVEELLVVAETPHCASLTAGIARVFSSDDCKEYFDYLVAAASANDLPDHAQEEPTCRSLSASHGHTLLAGTIALLLTSALTAPLAGSIPQATVIALLRKQRTLTRRTYTCTHPLASSTKNPLPLFEQQCTPSSHPYHRDWRESLGSELQRHSYHQRDSILRSVARICQELESRCENVEEPLRQERKKVQDLEHKVSRLQSEILELETDAIDRNAQIDGLEEEKSQFQHELDTTLEKSTDLKQALEQLRLDMLNANREAEQTLRAAQERFDVKELELESSILSRDEVSRLQEAKLTTVRGDNESLRRNMQTLQADKDSLTEQLGSTSTRANELEQQLLSEQKLRSQQCSELAKLRQHEEHILQTLRNAETSLQEATSQLNELRRQHQALTLSSEETLQSVRAEHQQELQVSTAKAAHEMHDLQVQLQEALVSAQKAKDAHQATSEELQLCKNGLVDLEDEIRLATEACTDKDDELQQLRAWKNGVMTSIGAATPLHVRAHKSTQHATDCAPQHSTSHRRRKAAMQSQRSAPNMTHDIPESSNDKHDDTSMYSSDSSIVGSTPKRPKPRQPSKASTTHNLHGEQQSSASKIFARPSRSTLGEISPNRRRTTVGFSDDAKVPKNRRASLHLPELASRDLTKLSSRVPPKLQVEVEAEEESTEW